MSLGGEHIGSDGGLVLNKPRFIPLALYESLKQGKVEAGDILLVKDGATTGKTAFVRSLPYEHVAVNEHVFLIRSRDPNLIDNEFLYFYLRSSLGQHQVRERFHGLIGGVNRADVQQITVAAPPLPEQRTIAHVLRTVEQAREQTEQVISAARELKRSLMRHFFTYGPITVGEAEACELQESDMGLIPARWSVRPLEEVATLQRGFDITKAEQQPGPYPVVSSSGPQSAHSEFKVRAPGVVVGRKGSVGKVHFVEDDFWPHDTTLWVKDFHGHSPAFVFRLLERFDFSGYVTGVANPSLNRNHVHPARVGLPSAEEQAEIVADLGAVASKIAAENRRRDALTTLFNSLLSDLMTARLRVEHLAADPA